ncbi:hypothetical protein QYF36_023928 [Acer negundo]|nr:hypothetical protein QYF36_023928 [Acer negundo]
MLVHRWKAWLPPQNMVIGNGRGLSLDSAPLFDFVQSCSYQVGVKDFEFLCVLWWQIWHRRNLAFHNQYLLLDSTVYDWTASFIKEYRTAWENENVQVVKEQVRHRWEAPPSGILKINIDTALNIQDRVSRLGIVIQDYIGRVVSCCRKILTGYLPQIVEALAILERIRLAVELDLFPAVLESNALLVVKAIHMKDSPLSAVGVVVDDIMNLHSQASLSGLKTVRCVWKVWFWVTSQFLCNPFFL